MMHPSTGMTRRSFLTITAMTGGLLAAGGVARLGRSDASSSQPVTVRDERLLMGTVIHLAVVAPDAVQGQGAIAATFSAMQRLIGYFDYRRADSALGIPAGTRGALISSEGSTVVKPSATQKRWNERTATRPRAIDAGASSARPSSSTSALR